MNSGELAMAGLPIVSSKKKTNSVFAAAGMAKTIAAVCDEIRELYLLDAIPWVIGYSGGEGFNRSPPTRLAGSARPAAGTAAEVHPRGLDRHARRAADRGLLGSRLAREDEDFRRRATDSHHPAPACARDQGHLLGEPYGQGLSGAAERNSAGVRNA